MMHSPMYGGGLQALAPFLTGLHVLFALSFLAGVVLFFVWAAKHLSAKALKTWSMWLIGVGVIGAIITALLGFHAANYGGFGSGRGGMMRGGYNGQQGGMMRGYDNQTGDQWAGYDDQNAGSDTGSGTEDTGSGSGN